MRRTSPSGFASARATATAAAASGHAPEREEDVGLVLESPLPAVPGGRIEAGLEDPVDERGQPLDLDLLADDEATLPGLEPLEGLARDARRIEEPARQLGEGEERRGPREAGRVLGGRGRQPRVDRRRLGRRGAEPRDPLSKVRGHGATPGARALGGRHERRPGPAGGDPHPGERTLGLQRVKALLDALLRNRARREVEEAGLVRQHRGQERALTVGSRESEPESPAPRAVHRRRPRIPELDPGRRRGRRTAGGRSTPAWRSR